MQRIEDHLFPLVASGVARDHFAGAADHDFPHERFHQHLPMPILDRHRIIVGLIPHQRLRTGARGALLAGFVGAGGSGNNFSRSRSNRSPIVSWCPHTFWSRRFAALLQQMRVQLLPTGHARHRDHEVAPRIAHQPFHVPFVVALPGAPELRRKQIVRLQSAERLGGLALAIAGDLLHRDAVLSYRDGPRHAAKVREGPVVSFQKGLGVLGRKRHHEAVVGVRR